MDVVIKDISLVKKEITITIPQEEVDKERANIIKQYAQHVKLPGFRPGKVPTEVVESRFKKEIDGELEESLINYSTNKAVAEKQLKVVKLTVTKKPESLPSGFIFTVSADVLPEINIEGYKEIEVTTKMPVVNDEHIDKVLKDIAEEHSILTPREESEAVGENDAILTEVKFIYNGVPAGGEEVSEETVPIPMFARLSPALKDLLVGKKTGDTVKHQLEEGNPETKAPKVEIEIPIKKIYSREPHPINDELAQHLGDTKNLQELKERIKAKLDSDLERQMRMHTEKVVLDKLIERNLFPIPEPMVDMQINSMITKKEDGTLTYHVKNENRSTTDFAKAKADLFEDAEKIAREVLILDEIANKEDIKVTETEMDQLIRMSQAAKKEPLNKIKAKMKQSGEWNEFQFRLRAQKVLDFLVKNAKVTREELKPEEQKS